MQKRLVRKPCIIKDNEPAYKRLGQAIACTLMDSKLRGCSKDHLEKKGQYLRTLANSVNLFRPREVTLYVLNATNCFHPDRPLSNGYKKRIFEYCADFCKSNQLPFDKPKLNYQAPIPIIPTTKDVEAIINTCNKKYACIFTILAEIGCSQMELHRTPQSRIDKEEGKISIIGTKQHANRVYKLKKRTANMLREYLSVYTVEYPFPTPTRMRDAWVRARKRAVAKLCKPELNNIPLKNLRNYAGAQFYLGIGHHDPIATMRFMRHKRLGQTLHYIQSIDLDEPEEYTTQVVQLGQPDTLKRIKELSDAGYQFFCEADGHQAFRKRK
jgi:integrase